MYYYLQTFDVYDDEYEQSLVGEYTVDFLANHIQFNKMSIGSDYLTFQGSQPGYQYLVLVQSNHFTDNRYRYISIDITSPSVPNKLKRFIEINCEELTEPTGYLEQINSINTIVNFKDSVDTTHELQTKFVSNNIEELTNATPIVCPVTNDYITKTFPFDKYYFYLETNINNEQGYIWLEYKDDKYYWNNNTESDKHCYYDILFYIEDGYLYGYNLNTKEKIYIVAHYDESSNSAYLQAWNFYPSPVREYVQCKLTYNSSNEKYYITAEISNGDIRYLRAQDFPGANNYQFLMYSNSTYPLYVEKNSELMLIQSESTKQADIDSLWKVSQYKINNENLKRISCTFITLKDYPSIGEETQQLLFPYQELPHVSNEGNIYGWKINNVEYYNLHYRLNTFDYIYTALYNSPYPSY